MLIYCMFVIIDFIQKDFKQQTGTCLHTSNGSSDGKYGGADPT